MAYVDFPSELPAPERTGYGFKPVSTFARTEMTTGRARQRRVRRSVPTMSNVTWTFTQPEAQLFEVWFSAAINDGADWFYCNLNTPMGIKPYRCRFSEMYTGPKLFAGNMWQYSAELELFERPMFAPEWYLYGREFLLGADIIDKAINREWPEA